MTTTITILVVVMIVGIIFVNRSGALTIKSREHFLQEFTKYVEGKLSPMSENEAGSIEGSYRVEFNLDQFSFVFEDVMLPSFKEKLNKAYLKMQLPMKVSLQFHERKQQGKLFDQNVGLYKSTNDVMAGIKMPEKLIDFQIQTDDIELIKKLL